MLRAQCPECGAKVKAPDELSGKRGRCPTCNTPVRLPFAEPALAAGAPPTSEELPAIAMAESDEEAPDVVDDPAANDEGLIFKRPEHLKRNCHYMVCNSKDVIARWDDDGKGWMVHVKDGFVKASNNPKQIPSMGNYVFIEIEIVSEGPHQRLAGVHVFTLPGAFALMKLAKKNDNAILEALEQTTQLNDRQRALVRQRVNAQYLPNIWDDAAEF